MNDSVTWLTYDELAARLGIERESARQHVKQKRLARLQAMTARSGLACRMKPLDPGLKAIQ